MPPRDRHGFRTAILCALKLEADAVETQISTFYNSQDYGIADGDPNTYTLGQLGGHDVVVVWMPSEGNSLSSGATASLTSSFPRIDLALLVGVCAGVPWYSKSDRDVEVILGDVVISTAVVEYDHGRQFSDAFRRKETLSQAPIAIRSRINQISSRRLTEVITSNISNYMKDLARSKPDYAYPGVNMDKLFNPEYIHKHHHVNAENCVVCSEHQSNTSPICEQARTATCQELQCDENQLVYRRRLNSGTASPAPAIHFGRIASGNVVMKSGYYRDIHARNEGVIAFEMEAAGIWSRMACIVIKGVCDYADSHKNKRFQEYAAASAAACARAVLEELPVISTADQQHGMFEKEAVVSNGNPRISSTLLPRLNATEPHLDMKELRQEKGDVLPQGFSWILTDKRFLDWRDQNLAQLLCIKGDPGKGKTMISIGLIDYLSVHLQQIRDSTNLAYFFCQNTDNRRKTSISIIKGLLWLLIERKRSLERHLQERLVVRGDMIFESFQELWEVFLLILRDVNCTTTVVVIDAIDECDRPDQEKLLQYIRGSMKDPQCRVKWLLTSRNSANVEKNLLEIKLDHVSSSSSISLEDEHAKVSEAVDTFIESRVGHLALSVPYDPPLKEFVTTALKNKAEGTFLWVSIVCDELQHVPNWQTEATLGTFPPGLEPLYSRMLDVMQQTGNSKSVSHCKKVLRSALVACRPIHIVELSRLAELPMELCENIGYTRDLVARCGSFLAIKEQNIVTFIHQSAKDYLKDVSRSRLDALQLHDEHLLLAKACVGIMDQSLRWNIGNYCSLDDMPHRAAFAPLERCDYSVQFWSQHIKEASLGGPVTALENERILQHFIQRNMLCWLEYLTSVGKLSTISTTINDLSALSTQFQRLHDLIFSAMRLCVTSAHIINIWPMQVYHAAFLFDPETTSLKQYYEKRYLKWVKCAHADYGRQQAQHRTIEGHATQSDTMALSTDGRFVVFDLARSALKICCAATGLVSAVVQHASRITSIAISWDTKFIATASEDTKVRLFDIDKNYAPREFGGHTLRVNAVTFSRSRNVLASASDDETIRLWDTTSNSLCGVLKHHRGRVNSITFHPGGKVLASGSSDMTVIIWDVEAKVLLTAVIHQSEVLSVVFSKNGKLLVSGLADGSIVIQQVRNSKLEILRTIEPLEHAITFRASIDISPDSKTVLSTCPDRTIKLWDVETGTLSGSFGGHEKKITAAAFLPNGKSIASSSWDKTIRIWNIDQNVFDRGTAQSSAVVAAIAFSPNGKLIATACGTPEVTLWDVETASQVHNFNLDARETVWKVAFTDDGKSLHINEGSLLRLNCAPRYIGASTTSIPARIDIRDDWILWKQHKMIWLPSEYRPLTFATRENQAALFCRSGRILIITFDTYETEAMLRRLHG